MKTSVKKIIALEVVMILVLIISFFLPFLFSDYKYLIFLLLAGTAVYFIVGIDITKGPRSGPIFKNLLIYLMILFLIMYLSGLFIGFNRTIYSFSVTNFIKNILPATVIILVCELLRYQFIQKSNNDRVVIILSYILFVLFDICVGYYNYDLTQTDQIYEFIGLVVLASLTRNILMTIFDIKTDYTNAVEYRIVMELYIYLVPIVPALGPYINSVILIIFPIILSFSTINNTKKKKTLDKPKDKRLADIAFVVAFVILSVLVLLNSGFIKYQTLVIGSNSMKVYMSRGDVVLIEKYNNREKDKLKKNDILVFKYDNKIITHRIIDIIERDNAKYYVTKGDNNNSKDEGVRDASSVIGVVKLRIKKIGLPSIWINELFN